MKAVLPLLSLLWFSFFLSGCVLTSEDKDKDKLDKAQIDLAKLADQIIITYPANDSVIKSSNIIVRADIPADAKAEEVILYVDGIETAKDNDGSPWEISWPAYYWGDGEKHTLLLKTITGDGNEVRNNQQFQVTVSQDANKALAIKNPESQTSLINVNTTSVSVTEFPNATS